MKEILPIIQPRTCGDCRLCCTVMGVQDEGFSKPENFRCPHVHKKIGCKIYETRPESCRKFECLWLQGNFSEEMKPTELHAVFHITPSESIVICSVDPNWPLAHKKLPLLAVIKYIATKYPVLIKAGKDCDLVLDGNPSPEEERKIVQRLQELNPQLGLQVVFDPPK